MSDMRSSHHLVPNSSTHFCGVLFHFLNFGWLLWMNDNMFKPRFTGSSVYWFIAPNSDVQAIWPWNESDYQSQFCLVDAFSLNMPECVKKSGGQMSNTSRTEFRLYVDCCFRIINRILSISCSRKLTEPNDWKESFQQITQILCDKRNDSQTYGQYHILLQYTLFTCWSFHVSSTVCI